MRRLDKQQAINFVDVGAEDAACPIDRQLLLPRFHAQEAGGPIIDGAAAFAAMWRVIPAFRPLGLIAKIDFVLSFLEWVYNKFLKVRPALQRLARP